MKEEEIKKKLSKEEYEVLREGKTEAPFTGGFLKNKKEGLYKCKICGSELFSSKDKFDSGTGWPSFSNIVSNSNTETREIDGLGVDICKRDTKYGMERVEVLCKNCGSHLGYVFPDSPKEKGGNRYCINSVCLEFSEDGKTSQNSKGNLPDGRQELKIEIQTSKV